MQSNVMYVTAEWSMVKSKQGYRLVTYLVYNFGCKIKILNKSLFLKKIKIFDPCRTFAIEYIKLGLVQSEARPIVLQSRR